MWAIARYDLSLTSDEFYALTPRQFDALLKRREYEQQTTEYLFGQLTSYLINFSMCRPKDPTAPADFMPSQWGKKQQPKRVRMTRARRQAVTESFRAGFAALLQRQKPNASNIDNRQRTSDGEAKVHDGQTSPAGSESGSA